ncbi:uncharacterized protein M6B38_116265 [Iris pallida]|uniref:Uncharacterized protein n=1 Tax=Iris pallida TaxID=29817 RepID=A0AAX6FEF4_IRIPA|nr:uncharacterized protein M6B38_141195 [Iris pallida]KAJ6848077.1 uncharacterized protein M6B38_116265 [Iris pallida]
MALRLHFPTLALSISSASSSFCNPNSTRFPRLQTRVPVLRIRSLPMISAALPPLDLTEDNIRQVLVDSRTEAISPDL